MEDDELTQLTLLDPGDAHREAELWEREQRQTKVGRPRKGEEKKKPEADTEVVEGVSGARMRGATRQGAGTREGNYARSEYHAFDAGEVVGRRVARGAVVAALKRARGRIRSPERWTPLHLAASAKEGQRDLCWWGRWPPPDSPKAVKWSAEGAVIAVTPDAQTQALAWAALKGIGEVERSEGHAATVQYIERRIEAVGGIAAEYVTRADILAAVAGLPAGGREREDE